MTSRAELTEELRHLRAEMDRLDEKVAVEPASTPDPEPAPEPEPDPEVEAELAQILSAYGVDLEDIQELGAQFRTELENLPRDRPLVALLGAFALGVVVGRMTKRGS